MDVQMKRILRRLKLTRRGETICLADWEARLVVEYIENAERRKKEDGSAEV